MGGVGSDPGSVSRYPDLKTCNFIWTPVNSFGPENNCLNVCERGYKNPRITFNYPKEYFQWIRKIKNDYQRIFIRNNNYANSLNSHASENLNQYFQLQMKMRR